MNIMNSLTKSLTKIGEYGCRKEQVHFTYRVKEFTRPTTTLQENVHPWYKVLLIWWGSFGTNMILQPLFLQQ